MLWINRLLRKTLIPLKKEHDIPLILIGHSFGSRAISRGIFGYPFELNRDHLQTDIDIAILLQSAFSIYG
jgi:hypothetical protein